jgi:hypothetical protein
MFSSRTLAERNNDPEPWANEFGDRFEDEGIQKSGYTYRYPRTYQPRRGFNQPRLPANPILVRFREQGHESVFWADLDRHPTNEELAHALRVLHLRATLTKATK